MLPTVVRTTNGSGSRILAPAAPLLDNMIVGTAMMRLSLDSYVTGVQQNIWGKATGGDRSVFACATSNVFFNYGPGTTGTICRATANVQFLGNLSDPAAVNNKPAVIAVTWTVGGAVAPRLFGGLNGNDINEATAYVNQGAGTTGDHNDSGTVMDIMATSGGGNVPTGWLWSLQFWNVVLADADIRHLAQTYNPAGCVASWRMGAWGTGPIRDDSGHGTHLTMTTAVPQSYVWREANSMRQRRV